MNKIANLRGIDLSRHSWDTRVKESTFYTYFERHIWCFQLLDVFEILSRTVNVSRVTLIHRCDSDYTNRGSDPPPTTQEDKGGVEGVAEGRGRHPVHESSTTGLQPWDQYYRESQSFS